MPLKFKLAQAWDLEDIWIIVQEAILRRKKEGSKQWQDGYPNPDVLRNDIRKQVGYMVQEDSQTIGYFTIMINDEPGYKNIVGNWLTEGDFLVIHRMAISDNHLGKGYAKMIFRFVEAKALQKQIFSIKVDTNFDNYAMLHLLHTLGYTYCGEVHFRGCPRKAFEKMLVEKIMKINTLT